MNLKELKVGGYMGGSEGRREGGNCVSILSSQSSFYMDGARDMARQLRILAALAKDQFHQAAHVARNSSSRRI